MFSITTLIFTSSLWNSILEEKNEIWLLILYHIHFIGKYSFCMGNLRNRSNIQPTILWYLTSYIVMGKPVCWVMKVTFFKIWSTLRGGGAGKEKFVFFLQTLWEPMIFGNFGLKILFFGWSQYDPSAIFVYHHPPLSSGITFRHTHPHYADHIISEWPLIIFKWIFDLEVKKTLNMQWFKKM